MNAGEGEGGEMNEGRVEMDTNMNETRETIKEF
jgi:hypothetical protein